MLLRKGRISARRRIVATAERRLQRPGSATRVRSILADHRILSSNPGALLWGFGFLLAYFWLTFVLRRSRLRDPGASRCEPSCWISSSGLGEAMLQALPGLFTVALIVVITRFVIRLVQLLFQAVEDGRVTLPGIYPETAQPTRKIVTVACGCSRSRSPTRICRQRLGRVQRHERVRRAGRVAGLERDREPGDERIHADLLARAPRQEISWRSATSKAP